MWRGHAMLPLTVYWELLGDPTQPAVPTTQPAVSPTPRATLEQLLHWLELNVGNFYNNGCSGWKEGWDTCYLFWIGGIAWIDCSVSCLSSCHLIRALSVDPGTQVGAHNVLVNINYLCQWGTAHCSWLWLWSCYRWALLWKITELCKTMNNLVSILNSF